MNKHHKYSENNIEEPQQIYKNNMKNLFYYYQTLRVGQHHTMDPIMEGIISCSLSSSRGHPPIEIQLTIQYFSSCPITLLEGEPFSGPRPLEYSTLSIDHWIQGWVDPPHRFEVRVVEENHVQVHNRTLMEDILRSDLAVDQCEVECNLNH
jgi:hypothetical protein